MLRFVTKIVAVVSLGGSGRREYSEEYFEGYLEEFEEYFEMQSWDSERRGIIHINGDTFPLPRPVCDFLPLAFE
jgi:hypothetical protein